MNPYLPGIGPDLKEALTQWKAIQGESSKVNLVFEKEIVLPLDEDMWDACK